MEVKWLSEDEREYSIQKLCETLAAERQKNAEQKQRYEKLALSESRLVQCEIELRNQIEALKNKIAELQKEIVRRDGFAEMVATLNERRKDAEAELAKLRERRNG